LQVEPHPLFPSFPYPIYLIAESSGYRRFSILPGFTGQRNRARLANNTSYHRPFAAKLGKTQFQYSKREIAVVRTMLQAKLHRARVTQCLLDYEGSCGIDEDLLDVSGILPNQYIEIYNVTNGERFCTYAIRGRRGSGEISLNGAAARKVAIGDILIICAYSAYNEAEVASHQPIVVLMNENNQVREVIRPAVQQPSIAA
jgi:aspartate 1-decarboxylase